MYEQKFISTLSNTQLLLKHRITFQKIDFDQLNEFDIIANHFWKEFSIELDIPVSKYLNNYTYTKVGNRTSWTLILFFDGLYHKHEWTDKRQAMDDLSMRRDDMRSRERTARNLFIDNINDILWATLRVDLFSNLGDKKMFYEVLFKKIFNTDNYNINFSVLKSINNKIGGSPIFDIIKDSFYKAKRNEGVSLVGFDRLLGRAFSDDISGVIKFLNGSKTNYGYVYEYTPSEVDNTSVRIFDYIFHYCEKVSYETASTFKIIFDDRQLIYKLS